MGRSERDAFFERLVAMRDGYGADDADRGSALSIGDAIRYADAIMTAVEHDAEPRVAEPPGFVHGAGDEPGRSHGPRFASDLWPWPIRRPGTTVNQDDVDRD